MISNSKYHKNYTAFGEPYQLVLPLNLESLVPDDDSVRLLSHELEDLDYSLLYQAYSAKGRNPAVDPKTMFKILTYAYSQNIYSTRKIETACRRDINFMWLLATMGELSKETIFIDGTKLEACANKYTFVWKKSVGKWEEKMYEKIENAVQMVNREYMQDFCISKENRTSVLHKMVDYLDHYCRENSIVFVHGRGKRKSMHQRYLELFQRFLDRQLLYDLHHSHFGSRNSYSKTDVDATFMHMKDDHMRNAQ